MIKFKKKAIIREFEEDTIIRIKSKKIANIEKKAIIIDFEEEAIITIKSKKKVRIRIF